MNIERILGNIVDFAVYQPSKKEEDSFLAVVQFKKLNKEYSEGAYIVVFSKAVQKDYDRNSGALVTKTGSVASILPYKRDITFYFLPNGTVEEVLKSDINEKKICYSTNKVLLTCHNPSPEMFFLFVMASFERFENQYSLNTKLPLKTAIDAVEKNEDTDIRYGQDNTIITNQLIEDINAGLQNVA